MQGGVPLRELLHLDDRPLTLMTFDDDGPGLALGTRAGVVKRVKPDHLSNRDEWDLMTLADGDEVVGAAPLLTGDEQLAFVTSDAQLLRFDASLVRPQGRSGGGVAGVKLADGAKVVAFGVVRDVDTAHVVSVAGSGDALPGTQTGSVKVSPLGIYPAKGRATGGVRCQRLLKGEDGLILAWVGDGSPIGCATSGSPVELPEPTERRDASGVPAAQPLLAVAGPVAVAARRRPPPCNTESVRTRLLAMLAAALLLAGCQGDSDAKKADTSELQKRLSAARTTIDEAETVDISLATKSLPDGVTGLLSATGQGNHSPAFKGKVKVVTGGSTLSADVVSAEGTLKAKTSFSPLYLKIDPASLKAPDPAALLDAENGVTQILEKTKGLKDGDKSRDGSDVLTTITGTLPGSVVAHDHPVGGRVGDIHRQVPPHRRRRAARRHAHGPVLPRGRRRHLHGQAHDVRQARHDQGSVGT